MELHNYECDGQLNIFDVIADKKKELDKKYDIPRDYQKEEGWTDDWHYTEMETPKEHGIYYCITHLFNSEHYNYTYMAWHGLTDIGGHMQGMALSGFWFVENVENGCDRLHGLRFPTCITEPTSIITSYVRILSAKAIGSTNRH